MTNINKLFKEPDREQEIFNWLLENQKNKIFSNNLNRFLNLLLDNKDIVFIEEVFDTFEVNTENTKDKQLGILLIRFHCLAETPKLALGIYEKLEKKNRRKRHLTIIIHAFLDIEDDDMAYNIYEEFLVDEYPIDIDDLIMFSDTEFSKQVAKSGIGFDLIFPNELVKKKDQVTPDKNLKKFELSKKEKKDLLNSIKKQFEKKKNIDLDNNFTKQVTKKDVIIDGANVLFYGDRAITPDSYFRLNKSIEELEKMGKSVLVVLHERHFSVKKYKWKSGKDIVKKIIDGWDMTKFYKTPKTFNDDWYSIIASVTTDSYILTNDNFNDHVFGAFEVLRNGKNVFRRWKQEYGIFYKFKNYSSLDMIRNPTEYTSQRPKDAWEVGFTRREKYTSRSLLGNPTPFDPVPGSKEYNKGPNDFYPNPDTRTTSDYNILLPEGEPYSPHAVPAPESILLKAEPSEPHSFLEQSSRKSIEFDYPKKYTEEIQEIDNVIHVPLTNSKWVVF